MPTSTLWRVRPVFISSTFKDMHAERDWLRNHVFPELEERLRERFHHLETIDLRLGVQTVEEVSEETREFKVLQVCLSEIERSRPFLIVLLGDRYGWVPPAERMERAAHEAGFSAEVAGKSVTALEIEFGLKKDPAHRNRSFFYFREPLSYAAMPDEKRAQYSEEYSSDPRERAGYVKLQALKVALMADTELHERIRLYRVDWDRDAQAVTGLEAFGQMVLDDLWSELNAETQAYVEQSPVSWEEAERRALKEFVEERGRLVIGRDAVVDGLLRLAHSPAEVRLGSPGVRWGVCLTGAAGAGKSALFAALYKRLSADESVVLLAHAAGISLRAGQVDSMLRRWVGELAHVLEIAAPPSDDALADELEKTFHEYIERVSKHHRVVVLIDALNQFEAGTRARYLTWLPKLWPANARLIATTIVGTESETLDERAGLELEVLPPLVESDARQIVAAVCKRYHRELHQEIVDAVVTKQLPEKTAASGNPLWLNLAVEQLNLLDADDFERAERDYSRLRADQRLHQLLLDTATRLPPDVEGMYGWMLERTELVYGARWAKAFASVTAVSRFGWRESDLKQIIPGVVKLLYPDQPREDWDDLKLASLRRGFRAHLRQRGTQGQWDFFHAQMRQAIERRNLGDADCVRQMHRTIANHLAGLGANDPLRQTELMAHLVGADMSRNAARWYADAQDEALTAATETLVGLIRDDSPATDDRDVRYWRMRSRDIGPGLQWVCDLCTTRQRDDVKVDLLSRLMFVLCSALAAQGSWAERRVILSSVTQELDRLFRTKQKRRVASLLADAIELSADAALQGHMQTTLARQLLEEALVLRERNVRLVPNNIEYNLALANTLTQLAGLRGNKEYSEYDLPQTRELLLRGAAILGLLAESECDRPTIVLQQMWFCLRLIPVCIGLGCDAEARTHLQLIDRLCELHAQSLGNEPDFRSQISDVLQQLGTRYLERDQLSEARRWLQKCVELDAQVETTISTDEAQSRGIDLQRRLGDLCLREGSLEEGRHHVERSLRTSSSLAERLPTDIAAQRQMLVAYICAEDFFNQYGDPEEAQRCRQQQSLVIRRVRARGMEFDALLSLLDPDVLDSMNAPNIEAEGSAKDDSSIRAESRLLPPELSLSSGVAARVSRPHPGADPDRAARLNIEYQRALAEWKSLPFWKRIRTKKPGGPGDG